MSQPRRHARPGFTLIELLVVVAIIAILAAILFPVFARSRDRAKRSACVNNLKQIGMALGIYVDDYEDRLPDRRDLKSALPGGYRPWSSWPPSDPRSGWAAVVLRPYTRANGIWACPSVTGSPLGRAIQVVQDASGETASYWMWRFDRPDDPPPLTDLWGKSPERAVRDLRAANDPLAGSPEGPADVETVVDPYFPRTAPSAPESLKGRSAHMGGRNRLFLDGHVAWLPDARTQ